VKHGLKIRLAGCTRPALPSPLMQLFPASVLRPGVVGLVSCLMLVGATSGRGDPPLLAPAAGGSPSVAQANNAFAFDLYRKLEPAPGANVFFSPYSIETALAMTAAGARGATAAQMTKVLHLDGFAANALPAAFGAQQGALTGAGAAAGVRLLVANSLWMQQDQPIRPDYLANVQKDFGAALFTVDFASQAEVVRLRVNAWVGDKTEQRIKDLLHPGDVDARTRLILVNAIYFKGAWAEPFDAKATAPAPFTLAGGETKSTPLMRRKFAVARMAELPDDPVPLKILALPYQGRALEFVALLPDSPTALPDLEKTLTADRLDAWLGKLSRTYDVEVFLPKFKLEAHYGLGAPLAALGMTDAFTPRADFSGMDGAHDLMLGAAVHQAFVEVNEEGTEAAAATGVVVRPALMRAAPPVFRADHPFLFLIRDAASGAILFLGRLAAPAE